MNGLYASVGVSGSSVLGTSNQITITDNGNGTITISLAAGLDALVDLTNISITGGTIGGTTVINTAYATVASHATTSAIWAAAGNVINFTGTATLTDLPAAPQAGAQRTLICAGACVFTHAGNITVQGAATFTAAAGDVVVVTAISTTTFKVNILKQDGKSIILTSTKEIWDAAAELTIATGSITTTQSLHLVDTQSDDASDDLDTIVAGTSGQLLAIRAAHTDRTVVVKHNTGNIYAGGSDISLDSDTKYLLFVYDGTLTKWVVIGGSAAAVDLTAPGAIGGTTAGTVRSLIDEDTEAASDTLTANQCSGGLIDNIGMGAADCNYTLPAVAEGYNLVVVAGEPSANYLRITAPLAGSMVVDGVPNKTYASLATPAKGNFMSVFTAKVAPGAAGILTGAALVKGSTVTAVANGAFTFYIAGVKYAKIADAVGVALTAATTAEDMYGAHAIDIDAAGTITSVPAADNTTGYSTAELAIAAIPGVVATKARMGTVTAIDTGAAFVWATNELATAGTVTVAFNSTAAYTAVFNYIVTTGAGVVTSG